MQLGPHGSLLRTIEQHLREHLELAAVASVLEALQRGQVVHIKSPKRPAIVAFKRGVLFVPGNEYVIGDGSGGERQVAAGDPW